MRSGTGVVRSALKTCGLAESDAVDDDDAGANATRTSAGAGTGAVRRASSVVIAMAPEVETAQSSAEDSRAELAEG